MVWTAGGSSASRRAVTLLSSCVALMLIWAKAIGPCFGIAQTKLVRVPK